VADRLDRQVVHRRARARARGGARPPRPELELRRDRPRRDRLAPGEHRYYSNIGYRAVGAVLEAITGEPYAHNPWLPTFLVAAQEGALAMGTDWLDGRAQHVVLSGTPYYRAAVSARACGSALPGQ